MKKITLIFALFFVFGLLTQTFAQDKVQVVYKNEAGTTKINPSFDDPFPVKDSSLVQKLDSLLNDLDRVKTAVQLIDNSISGSETQVDLVGSVPAGTNNIGDVDVASLPSITSGFTTFFSGITFDDDPTADTTYAIDISGKRKISFSAVYDETEVGNSISAALTLQVSTDSTTWTAYDAILDGSGTDAPNASIAFSADGSDFFWLPEGVTAKYLRAIITFTNTDADDTGTFVLNYFWQAE